jgi:hypothetical protein
MTVFRGIVRMSGRPIFVLGQRGEQKIFWLAAVQSDWPEPTRIILACLMTALLPIADQMLVDSGI